MPEQRRITKISGRRLYDEQERQPITLDRIALLIQDGTNVTVLDRKNQKDITTIVLLQIIEKMAGQKVHLLPEDVLRDLIRLRPQQSAPPQPSNGSAELHIVNSSGLMQVATEN